MKTKPEKYTREFVLSELKAMISESLERKSMVLMSELFVDRDYSPQRLSEWEDKFKDDEEISESIKKLKSIFEHRINIGGLRNKLNPTMTIFNLKNNYNWKDRTERDITSDGEKLSIVTVKFEGKDAADSNAERDNNTS